MKNAKLKIIVRSTGVTQTISFYFCSVECYVVYSIPKRTYFKLIK